MIQIIGSQLILVRWVMAAERLQKHFLEWYWGGYEVKW